MDKINPVVITSKQADTHLNKIRSEHTDVLRGLQDQAVKVQEYNQQKEISRKEQEAIDTENESKQLEQINKSRELEIKANALAI